MMVCPRLILEYTFWLTLRRQPDYAKKRYLVIVFDPSIYRIFRASHNAKRWCIINQMFANSLPVDARVKNYR